MNARRRSRGFTLIEVLVALGIVAIALAAGVQATASLTANAFRQSDMVLAQLCAENELARVRLARQMPGVGDTASSCAQGGQVFDVTLSVAPTPNPNFLRIDARVHQAASTLLRVSTIMGRF